METNDVGVKLEDNKIKAYLDSDNDGVPSAGLELKPFGILKALKDGGEGAKVSKTVEFRLEGGKLVGDFDVDQDGEPEGTIFLDGIETLDESTQRF